MTRGAYLALVWPPAASASAAAADALGREVTAAGGWRAVAQRPGLRIWVDAAVGLDVHPLPRDAGVVLGDLWPAHGAAGDGPFMPAAEGRDAAETATRLCRAHWGRYVALLDDGAAGLPAVFRDPSGLLEALTWSLADGLEVVASDPTRPPTALRPRWPALNWDRIATYVGLLSAATSDPLFDGIEAIGPGAMRTLGAPGAERLIWRPSAFVGTAAADPQALRTALVERVDRCAGALAGPHRRLIVELSGGLDSSIVAASLAAAGLAPRVAVWLNRAGDRPEGDERAYAGAVTGRLGVPLTVVDKPLTPIEPGDLTELADAFWPAINAVDPSRDRDEVARIHAEGVTGLVSGDGGDAVFLQPPSALIWDDDLRRRGLAAFGSPVLPNVARRLRTSIWQVMAEVAAERRGRAPPLMAPSRFASREVQGAMRPVAHAWVADARARGVSPARRLHVQAIANAHVFRGESRRARVADLLFPLLAQPVVELCLGVPTPDLAGEAYDRPFARAAFADRLPLAVLHRRAKGNLGSYFARLVAVSLPTLRPHLLDGCLVEAGVLDRAALDRALDPQQLLWGTRPNELLILAAVEAWVRYWQGRVPDSRAAPRRR